MIPQYFELSTDLERIRRFLDSSIEEQQTPDQRRFAYIACISALYSSFENFIERVAFQFSKMLLADPVNTSPEQMANLRRRYVRNASTLLSQNLGVGRYEEVTELDIAKSLASCLGDSTTSVDLRLELTSLHSSNIRWDSLHELFSWAITDLQNKIRRSDAVQRWMSISNRLNSGTLMGVLKSELDDLVERRNEVAHRAIPDEIQSYDYVRAKVDFIEAVSLGLIASLAGLIVATSIQKGGTISLGIPAKYYKKGRVIVIFSLESPVSEGDCVVSDGDSIRWGRVLEVQVQDVPVPSAQEGMEVGLLLNFAPNKGARIHLWQSPSSDLAFTPDNLFGNRGPLDDTS